MVLLLNIPALVVIVLAYVWLGLTELAAIGAVAVNKIPNVIVTMREGAKALDARFSLTIYARQSWAPGLLASPCAVMVG